MDVTENETGIQKEEKPGFTKIYLQIPRKMGEESLLTKDTKSEQKTSPEETHKVSSKE